MKPTRLTRPQIMARVKSKNTKPEIIVRRTCHALGLRFRLHRKDLPGSPDLVFRRWNTALFVHGCFWHRHENCPRASMPATNVDFWTKKFHRNKERDRAVAKALRQLGWRVHVVWECEVYKLDDLSEALAKAIMMPEQTQITHRDPKNYDKSLVDKLMYQTRNRVGANV